MEIPSEPFVDDRQQVAGDDILGDLSKQQSRHEQRDGTDGELKPEASVWRSLERRSEYRRQPLADVKEATLSA